MKAITLKNPGEPHVLTISNTPEPVPGPEQLLVRVKATALNRADMLQRRGKYPPPPGETDILGLEIAGDVVHCGDKVFAFRPGDRVFGLVGSGGYAEYCLIDHQTAMPIPEELSYIEAAAIPEAFLTATEALFTLGHLHPHETILIHAGGSGVGTAAIQLAKLKGAIIFTTVGSPQKSAKIKSLGADHIIQYKTTDFAEEIPSSSINVIIDFIGANYLSRHLALLKVKGRLICVGLMGGTRTEMDMTPILQKRLQIKGLTMRSRPLAEKRTITQHFITEWLSFFKDGTLKPVIDSIFPFQEVIAAHTYMENNANVGKIVLDLAT